ncbi:AAA family ATPase [Acinetobacter pragensis]|uniref:AAA family ATPase n=1 Tax=Acinetobacter pragensis TaxID=1806892 RepID=UPI0033405761
MKTRMHALISQVSEHMYEREQIIALSLLAGIAGMNTFLYGSPGTAKSLISRRIASAFEVSEYFEYLMNRFSTPEEIFGPVSIKALKDDQYLRKTEHYLPKADFAFLDEIWKASPAILNTLLTLVNEKTFKNGDLIQHVPLRVLMSASNEIPEPNQGLDALYDRFIMRLAVPPIQQVQNFHALLQAKPSAAKVEVSDDLRIKKQELAYWREQIHQVQLPAEILKIFDEIKHSLSDSFEEYAIYVSDRRWQRAAYLLKASAFINDRAEVNLLDVFILKHCLWSQIDDIAFVAQTIEQAVLEVGLDSDLDLAGSTAQKEDLEQRILNHFYYTDEVYESYLIRDREYVRAVTNLDHHYQDKTLYLELDKMDSKKDFFAVDASGEEIRGIVCNFNGGRQCTLKGGYYGLEEVVSPYVKYSKGSARTQLSAQIKYDLLQEVQGLQEKILQDYQILKQRIEAASEHFDSDFTAAADAEKLRSQLEQTLQRYDLQRQDCLRLEQLCRN